jgi:protein-arginine kinase activator protein McsA
MRSDKTRAACYKYLQANLTAILSKTDPDRAKHYGRKEEWDFLIRAVKL